VNQASLAHPQVPVYLPGRDEHYDLIVCEHFGDVLACLRELLPVLEQIHRVENLIDSEQRMVDWGISPGTVTAAQRLHAAGLTPPSPRA
jgi:hypothetical protein